MLRCAQAQIILLRILQSLSLSLTEDLRPFTYYTEYHSSKSHNLNLSRHEDLYLLEHNAVQSGKIWLSFRRKISPTSSGSKYNVTRKPALLVAWFVVVSCLAYCSTLKLQVMCFSETSVDFHVIE
jgi:hypothetical protein